ncbi:hypothetical protein MYXO_03495 [Myxococcaceae bacterium]|nr:hypothetical protein MYXO_03495 [Myxococcaceae bacterium]
MYELGRFRRGALMVGAALGLLVAAGRPAQALPVPPGGFTLVEVTSIAALLPLSPAPIAPALVDDLFGATFLRFPVTDVTGPLGSPTLVGHSGGLSLTNGVNVLTLTNYVIDVPAAKLFAEVNGSGSSDFPLFDLVPCSGLGTCPVGNASSVLTGIGLNLTPQASSALLEILGAQLPAGTPFGIVKQITVVPEPGTALLLLSGLAGLAYSSRRRS